MMIPLKLSRVVLSEINTQQAVFLKEADGSRQFPIVIGVFEAASIDRYVKGLTTKRPMTHDLVRSTIEAMGGTIQDIYIHRLESNTYYASIRIRRGEELIEIDSRPSDAIAVALAGTPPVEIFIEESVLDQAIRSSYE